jgi:hypothetical protein
MSDLETLYEQMIRENSLIPIGPFTVTSEIPSETDIDMSLSTNDEEEISEEREVQIARNILKLLETINKIAEDSTVKSYRNKLETTSQSIRELANELINGHPGID